ncbi:zinc finger, CCHC-type containing protein [Tanacetum coccineum]
MAFFEKQRLTGPNFIDWYRNLQIVLSVENKLPFLEQPIPAMPVPPAGQVLHPDVLATHSTWVKASKEIVGLMLMTMDPDIQKNLEQLGTYDMLKELKTFYIDNLERLGHAMTQNLAVSLILVSLRNEYDSFVQNYNMHDIGKTVTELHAMLKLHGQTLPKKDVAPALHAIRAGKVQKKHKNKKPQLAARGNNQGKGNLSLFILLNPRIPLHQRRIIQQRTRSVTNAVMGSRKLKPGALSLYVGDGHRAAVEAVGSYHLCLPSVLVLVLHNCHYAPSITRGIISISYLYDDGFINRFEDNTISVSRNNVVYFSAIPRNCIFEIDLSNYNTNDCSMYAVSNKRAKINLDSTLLWHCRLRHISKKRIEKLQHDGLLNSTNNQSFDKCVSCMSRKMARKPYTHQVERAKDLLGLIHTDVCGPFRTVSKQELATSSLSRTTLVVMNPTRYGSLHDDQTTLPKSFWDYALKSTARILSMVPTKKVEKTPYEIWHGKAPKLSYLKVWGCETLVKRDTLTKPEKLEPRSINLITQEASRSLEDLKIFQEEDTHPSDNTSLHHDEDDQEIDEPQSDINPVRRSTRTRCAPDRMCLYIDAEEHELGGHNEPTNYKTALLVHESEKWLDAMNVEMQSMKDKEVWDLVDLPPDGKTVGSKWLFKKKTDMDGAVHTYKARLVTKGFTQTHGVDYEETFSSVADIRAIRILIATVAFYDYDIWQMDVKTAFLS